LEVNHSRDFKILCDYRWIRLCKIKETDNNNKDIIHVGSHFSIGSTVQPKLFVIGQILPKMFVISRILAKFFLVYAIIRLIRISAKFFSSHPYFFRIADWGSA